MRCGLWITLGHMGFDLLRIVLRQQCLQGRYLVRHLRGKVSLFRGVSGEIEQPFFLAAYRRACRAGQTRISFQPSLSTLCW